jgi:hypothetical protein
MKNGKWKPRRFSIVLLPFAHRSNGSLSGPFFDKNKQTKVSRLQID